MISQFTFYIVVPSWAIKDHKSCLFCLKLADNYAELKTVAWASNKSVSCWRHWLFLHNSSHMRNLMQSILFISQAELNYTRSWKPILQSPSKYLFCFFSAFISLLCFNFITKRWTKEKLMKKKKKEETRTRDNTALNEEKRLKVTVSWINLIRVDCNFMMPPPDLLFVSSFMLKLLLPHFTTTKLAQQGDRFNLINEGGYGRINEEF